MVWTPHATVAAIVEKDGRFLVVEEMNEGRAVFNQPAGHIDEDEKVLDAVIRETLEETRWKVKPVELLGIYINKAKFNNVTYYRFCYICEPIEEVVSAVLDKGIIGAHWLTIEELRAQPEKLRSPMVLKCYEDYLKGQRYPMEVVYEHGQLS